MIEPLRGTELRVFRSLVIEYDQNTVQEIWVQLSRTPVPHEEIQEALDSLAAQGYVESDGDRWKATAQGLAIRESLLGTRHREGTPVWVEVDGGQVAAEFVAPGDPADARNDPQVGTVRDVAWVRYLEGDRDGTLGSHFYHEIDLR
jgi:hypothetical protein